MPAWKNRLGKHGTTPETMPKTYDPRTLTKAEREAVVNIKSMERLRPGTAHTFTRMHEKRMANALTRYGYLRQDTDGYRVTHLFHTTFTEEVAFCPVVEENTFSAHQVILINQLIRDEREQPQQDHSINYMHGQLPRAEALANAGYLKRSLRQPTSFYFVTDKFRKAFMSPRPPWETV